MKVPPPTLPAQTDTSSIESASNFDKEIAQFGERAVSVSVDSESGALLALKYADEKSTKEEPLSEKSVEPASSNTDSNVNFHLRTKVDQTVLDSVDQFLRFSKQYPDIALNELLIDNIYMLSPEFYPLFDQKTQQLPGEVFDQIVDLINHGIERHCSEKGIKASGLENLRPKLLDLFQGIQLDYTMSVVDQETFLSSSVDSDELGDKISGKGIAENFDAQRGDLLYGHRSPRLDLLLQAINKDLEQVVHLKGAAIQFIDAINNAKRAASEPGENRTDTQIYSDTFALIEELPAYNALLQHLDTVAQQKIKYDTSANFKAFTALKAEETNPYKLADEYHSVIKRGCKAGLYSATLPNSDHHIHFALDEIDIEEVVYKENNLYTAAELRCAYRLREQLGDRIHFYSDGIEVDAPWVSKPELWDAYTPRSSQLNE